MTCIVAKLPQWPTIVLKQISTNIGCNPKNIFPINHYNKTDLYKTADRTFPTANKVDHCAIKVIIN